jgi:DNA repair protein RadC
MIADLPVHLNIKKLSEDDRPREKLFSKGPNSISDAELLAIVLGSGSRQETAVQLAQKILLKHGNSLENLAKSNIEDLMEFKGVGLAKAISIIACLEISRRRKPTLVVEEKQRLRSSSLLYETVSHLLLDKPKEYFFIIYLDNKLKLIKTELLSVGSSSSTVVDVKIIAKEAVKLNAGHFALAHNHPSGTINPSIEDQKITNKIRTALELFDIKLIDHIIVGNQTYFSFADENML